MLEMGYQMNEHVIKRVNMFIPLPLMYIMNSVIKILENPDVAVDQAFYSVLIRKILL